MTTAPKLEFLRSRLENGLTVILHPDGRTPLAHVTVHYRVGSSYERPGNSGFAHLFEHLMFQGSANIDKNEHGRLVDSAGGRWNATTSKDRTNYYETLPSNHLSLGLWLEADRMRSLKITERNFENQRQTVLEEKKQSYDNRPYGKSFLRFDELAYTNWAYAHPIIGSEEDLAAARLEDVEAFHRRHYRPGNAILVISGDFSPDSVLEEVAARFNSMPNGPSPPEPDLSEPPQDGLRREDMVDPLAALPAILIGHHIPELGSPESYAMSILSMALSSGDSSTLRRLLIHERNWATGVSTGCNGYRGPQMFTVWLQARQGVDAEELLESAVAELERLTAEPLSEEELERARNQVLFRLVEGRKTVAGVGEALARYELLFGDAELVNREIDNYLKVGPEEVREAAGRFFRESNRSVLTVRPQ